MVVLPTVSRAELGVFAGFRNGEFGYGGAQVSNLGDAVPIATNVFLDRAGLGLCVKPPPLRDTKPRPGSESSRATLP